MSYFTEVLGGDKQYSMDRNIELGCSGNKLSAVEAMYRNRRETEVHSVTEFGLGSVMPTFEIVFDN